MPGTGLGAIVALSLTLGLLALALALLKRLSGGAGLGRGRLPLRVLQRTQVAPKQSIALVQVGERVLVVGIGDGGSSLLTELTHDAAERALVPAPRAARSRPLAGDARALESEWREAAAAHQDAAPARSSILASMRTALVARPPRRRAPAMVERRSPVVGSLLALLLSVACAAPHAAAQTAPTHTLSRSVYGPWPSHVTVTSTQPGPAVVQPVAQPIAPNVDLTVGEGEGALHMTGAVGIVVLLGVMTLLPALFLLMTSFTRILIVLHFVRTAIGAQTTPPSQLLVAIAVLLTGVIMHPVIEETNRTAIQPYLNGEIAQVEAYARALQPFRTFMLENVRDRDLEAFTALSGDDVKAETIDDVPTATVVSAFVISELRVAFQMGFVIFLPFVVVDLIVASVLMSLGMFMLPPVMISLPFKLLLFVLADGWTLVVQNLVQSFR